MPADPPEAKPPVAPGLLLALGLAVAAWVLAWALGSAIRGVQGPGAPNPVSPVPVAVLLGLLVGHFGAPGARFVPGLRLAVKRVLQAGIVLIGLKLSVLEVLRVGALGVPVVAGLVAFAIGVALLLASWAGVGRRLGLLAAASTGICGITATLAVAPAVGASDREVAYTVANVTFIGLAGMLLYPYLGPLLLDGAGVMGLFLGTAIHDTAQVMGAAMAYAQAFDDPRALEVATVAKLTRNALLVAVVPLLGWLASRESGASGGSAPLLPGFVVAFLLMSLVRTAGELSLEATGSAFAVLPPAAWGTGLAVLTDLVAPFLLATALAAVGVSTRLAVLRGLGWRPAAVGLGAALAVGAAAALAATWVGPLLGA